MLQVPQNVKDQYKRPLPGYATDAHILPSAKKDDGTQEEFISQIISLQTSVLQHQNQELSAEESQRKKLKRKEASKPKDKEVEKTLKEESDDTASDCSVDLDSELQDGLMLSEELHQELNEYIARNKSRGVKNLSPTVRNFLALQKIKEYFPEKMPNLEHEVQARAALLPINTSKVPALMRYRTLGTGVGAGNQL